MFKIAKSLFAIVAVAAIAVGSTGALFSDTEIIAGNSVTTGNIAIEVAGDESQIIPFVFDDMKPGYVKNGDLVITNTGSNPANITKIVDIQNDPATLAGVLDYKLSVEVSNGWNQMLYNYDVDLADVDGGNMYLGMLPSGMTMKVHESYRMETEAGNDYQNKTMTFDITINAEQLDGSLVLENKDTSNWDIIQGDAMTGTLTYGVMDETFDFSFAGAGLAASTDYTLVIGSDYPFTNGKLGSAVTDGSGNIVLNGSSDLGTVQNQKVWLIPSVDWNGTAVSGWNPSAYLFETGLIDYYES